jgi:hypothetical protein
MIGFFAQPLMEMEVETLTGAPIMRVSPRATRPRPKRSSNARCGGKLSRNFRSVQRRGLIRSPRRRGAGHGSCGGGPPEGEPAG